MDNNSRKTVDLDMAPRGGNRNNGVAWVLKIAAFLAWGGGFIAGIIAGKDAGKIKYYMDGSEFSFGTAFLVWIAAFIVGFIPYAFAEIVCLLQEANTIRYAGSIELPKLYTGTANSSPSSVVQPIDNKGDNNSFEYRISPSATDGLVPFKLKTLKVDAVNVNGYCMRLSLHLKMKRNMHGILTDIDINTIYGDSYHIGNVSFVGFKDKDFVYTSEGIYCEIPDSIMNSIKEVFITVNKYVIDEQLYLPGDDSLIRNSSRNWISEADFLNEVSNMGSCKEIAAYIEMLLQDGDPIASDELLSIVRQYAAEEKLLFKPDTRACMKKIRAYFGYEIEPEYAEEENDGLKTVVIPTQASEPVSGGTIIQGSVEPQAAPGRSKSSNIEIIKERAARNNQLANSQPQARYCPKCGKPMVSDALFCGYCGYKI